MTLRRRDIDLDDDAFAPFVEDVRAAVPAPPADGTARAHLRAMRAAAESAAHTAGPEAPAARRRRAGAGVRPLLRLGALTAGAVVALGGGSSVLAAAGVDLPDPLRAPFDAVGIDLPGQAADEAVEPTAPVAPPVDAVRERDTSAPEGSTEGKARRDRGRRDGERGGESRHGGSRSAERNRRQRGEEASDGKAGGARSGDRGRAPDSGDNPARSGAGAGDRRAPNRPATSPRRSAGRGAGPARSKPNPSRERRRTRAPAAPPAPVVEPAPAPTTTTAPESPDGTTTSP